MNCTRFLTALLAAAAFVVPARAVEGLVVPSLSRNLSDQWKHILPERAPFISKVTAVTPGQPFTVYYVLGQFARREGRVDVVADVKILKVAKENQLHKAEDVTHYCKAGGACGACLDDIQQLLDDMWKLEAAKK